MPATHRRRRALQDGRPRADQGRRSSTARWRSTTRSARRRRRPRASTPRSPATRTSCSRPDLEAGQHPGQAAQLPGQRRQRRAGARRAGADHPDQPRRQRAVADRQLRRRRCWRPTPAGSRSAAKRGARERLRARPERRLVEPEVLRVPAPGRRGAGSSTRAARSRASARRRACRRRTAPGAKLVDETLDASVRDGRAALDVARGLAPLDATAAARVLGVGHRVVHGGADVTRPRASSRRRSSRSCGH